MIPKTIHYCWFGGKPLPELAVRCMASWRRFLPDYEIREWNERNFDVNAIPYTREAYRLGKYAFVSDYARFWVLYHHGGLYFDTDVEVIRPLDDIIARGPFMGFETDPDGRDAGVNPGLGLGVNPGLDLVKKFLDYYEATQFEYKERMREQTTVVHIATQLLRESGLRPVGGIQQVAGVWLYPKEYFCPVSVTTGRLHITENTRTIHHYAASWTEGHRSLRGRLKAVLRRCLPESVLLRYSAMKNTSKP